MEKSSVPSSLERNQLETLFRSEEMSLFKNEKKNVASSALENDCY